MEICVYVCKYVRMFVHSKPERLQSHIKSIIPIVFACDLRLISPIYC